MAAVCDVKRENIHLYFIYKKMFLAYISVCNSSWSLQSNYRNYFKKSYAVLSMSIVFTFAPLQMKMCFGKCILVKGKKEDFFFF